MGSSKRLLVEINAASRHVIKALRLNRRLAQMRAAHPADPAIPTREECCHIIANLAVDYRGALARYCLAIESALPRNTRRIARHSGTKLRRPV